MYKLDEGREAFSPFGGFYFWGKRFHPFGARLGDGMKNGLNRDVSKHGAYLKENKQNNS